MINLRSSSLLTIILFCWYENFKDEKVEDTIFLNFFSDGQGSV